jgi:signal transduction histidine kinase
MNHVESGSLQPPPTPREMKLRETSHDLRNCLYTVKTGVELLRRMVNKDPQMTEILAIMERDLEKGNLLLTELLSAAREQT